jgi:quercetin dioxygenase-like cupin family protein
MPNTTETKPGCGETPAQFRPLKMRSTANSREGLEMDGGSNLHLTQLAEGDVIRIRDTEGKSLIVFEGRVWLTQDEDSRDIVLEAGESFVLDRGGVAIAQALRDASVLVMADQWAHA